MKQGNTIFITGANRGIGYYLVKECVSRQFNIIGTCRNIDKSKDLINIKYDNLNIFEMNVINELSISKVSENIKTSIDYLICNAGINNGFGNLFDEDHSHKEMLDVLNVNVLGCILTIKYLIRHQHQLRG